MQAQVADRIELFTPRQADEKDQGSVGETLVGVDGFCTARAPTPYWAWPN